MCLSKVKLTYYQYDQLPQDKKPKFLNSKGYKFFCAKSKHCEPVDIEPDARYLYFPLYTYFRSQGEMPVRIDACVPVNVWLTATRTEPLHTKDGNTYRSGFHILMCKPSFAYYYKVLFLANKGAIPVLAEVEYANAHTIGTESVYIPKLQRYQDCDVVVAEKIKILNLVDANGEQVKIWQPNDTITHKHYERKE